MSADNGTKRRSGVQTSALDTRHFFATAGVSPSARFLALLGNDRYVACYGELSVERACCEARPLRDTGRTRPC
jgi:hypothetical protein